MNSLRFFTIAIMALALISVTSCNKDDDEEDSIIGTWEYAMSLEGFSMTVTMTFNTDHSGTSEMVMVEDGETSFLTVNFTYSTNGSTLTMTGGGETITFSYSVSGNKLTLIEDGESIVYTKK